MNSSEMFNREKKARKLAAFLFGIRATAEEVASATEKDWSDIAHHAQCHPPHSKETIGLVVGYLTMAYHDESLNQIAEGEPKTAQQIADEAAEAADDPGCPYCGEVGGTIYEFDNGIEAETGYHDAGERCTICSPRRSE